MEILFMDMIRISMNVAAQTKDRIRLHLYIYLPEIEFPG